jgi:hypothetical protein
MMKVVLLQVLESMFSVLFMNKKFEGVCVFRVACWSIHVSRERLPTPQQLPRKKW